MISVLSKGQVTRSSKAQDGLLRAFLNYEANGALEHCKTELGPIAGESGSVFQWGNKFVFNCFCVSFYLFCGGPHLTPATWHFDRNVRWENKGHSKKKKPKETTDLTPE